MNAILASRTSSAGPDQARSRGGDLDMTWLQLHSYLALMSVELHNEVDPLSRLNLKPSQNGLSAAPRHGGFQTYEISNGLQPSDDLFTVKVNRYLL